MNLPRGWMRSFFVAVVVFIEHLFIVFVVTHLSGSDEETGFEFIRRGAGLFHFV